MAGSLNRVIQRMIPKGMPNPMGSCPPMIKEKIKKSRLSKDAPPPLSPLEKTRDFVAKACDAGIIPT